MHRVLKILWETASWYWRGWRIEWLCSDHEASHILITGEEIYLGRPRDAAERLLYIYQNALLVLRRELQQAFCPHPEVAQYYIVESGCHEVICGRCGLVVLYWTTDEDIKHITDGIGKD